MTIALRPSRARGHADYGWLDTFHSFSFADYFDPAHMGFRSLRVINDDTVRGGGGFPTHGHRDMEIVTYLVEGALEHKDSTGGHGVIRRGEVQHMSAGTGVRHSEFNASAAEDARLLQIWLLPEREGIRPGYQQKAFPEQDKLNRLLPIANRAGADGALPIHQDADIFASLLESGVTIVHPLRPGRGAWIQVVAGEIQVDGNRLGAGDGAAVEEAERIAIAGIAPCSEFLLFDLA